MINEHLDFGMATLRFQLIPHRSDTPEYTGWAPGERSTVRLPPRRRLGSQSVISPDSGSAQSQLGLRDDIASQGADMVKNYA